MLQHVKKNMDGTNTRPMKMSEEVNPALAHAGKDPPEGPCSHPQTQARLIDIYRQSGIVFNGNISAMKFVESCSRILRQLDENAFNLQKVIERIRWLSFSS